MVEILFGLVIAVWEQVGPETLLQKKQSPLHLAFVMTFPSVHVPSDLERYDGGHGSGKLCVVGQAYSTNWQILSTSET